MNNLRHVRKNDVRKLTQKDVADFLGIERSTYGKYEQGTSEPTFDTLCKLADYFKVSVQYLMGKEDIKRACTHGRANIEVTDEEIRIIQILRSLRETERNFLIRSAEAEATRLNRLSESECSPA